MQPTNLSPWEGDACMPALFGSQFHLTREIPSDQFPSDVKLSRIELCAWHPQDFLLSCRISRMTRRLLEASGRIGSWMWIWIWICLMWTWVSCGLGFASCGLGSGCSAVHGIWNWEILWRDIKNLDGNQFLDICCQRCNKLFHRCWVTHNRYCIEGSAFKAHILCHTKYKNMSMHKLCIKYKNMQTHKYKNTTNTKRCFTSVMWHTTYTILTANISCRW